MRRLASSLAIPLLLAVAALPCVPQSALAQRAPDVELRLVSQTPWNTPEEPRLRIAVRATNLGIEPVSDLGLAFVLHFPVRSRTAYEESLQTSPANSLLAPLPQQVKGELEPGGSRTFTIQQDLGFLGNYPNNVYPVEVDVRSGLATVATLRSAVVFLSFEEGRRRAEEPLRLSWTFVLHEPVRFDPEGTFDGPAVRAMLDPDRRLRRELDALTKLQTEDRPVPVDLVLSPTLVEQLDLLRAGYRAREEDRIVRVLEGKGGAAAAAQVVTQLRELVASSDVEVSAMPFAAPDIPALLRSDLAGDLGTLIRRGRAEVSRVTGASPDPTVLRPVGSYLDQQSLFTLSEEGFRLFVVDPDLVQRPPREKEFAQPATALLRVGAGPGETVTAVVPDLGLQSLLGSDLPGDDPRLAAQAVLGELAAIWLEEPAERRAVALALTENADVPGGLFGPLVSKISRAPWLATRPLTTLARSFPAPREPVRLTPHVGGRYPSRYASILLGDRGRIAIYRSMLVDPSPIPDRLETTLLQAEASEFTRDLAAGYRFLDAVGRRLRAEFDKVRPRASPVVTLTSRGGVIPVGISNETGYPVHLRVTLASNHLAQPAASQDVRIHGRSRTLLFRVEAKTTGRFPVQVRITTPSGYTLQTGQLVVRSTAYNLIALVITIGAAVFLLAWWARRFVPRRKTS